MPQDRRAAAGACLSMGDAPRGVSCTQRGGAFTAWRLPLSRHPLAVPGSTAAEDGPQLPQAGPPAAGRRSGMVKCGYGALRLAGMDNAPAANYAEAGRSAC